MLIDEVFLSYPVGYPKYKKAWVKKNSPNQWDMSSKLFLVHWFYSNLALKYTNSLVDLDLQNLYLYTKKCRHITLPSFTLNKKLDSHIIDLLK